MKAPSKVFGLDSAGSSVDRIRMVWWTRVGVIGPPAKLRYVAGGVDSGRRAS